MENNIIASILSDFPGVWKDFKRFRALLLDYLPNEKRLRNLIIISVEEKIPDVVYCSSKIDNILINNLSNRIIDAIGCDKQTAAKIINMWVEAVKNEEELHETTIEDISSEEELHKATIEDLGSEENYLHGKFIGWIKYGGCHERIIECNDLRYSMIPFTKIQNKLIDTDTEIKFRQIEIGGHRYAYDIMLFEGHGFVKVPIVNTGSDVLHRKGKIVNIDKFGSGEVYEKQNEQKYIIFPSNKNEYLRVGDIVTFELAVSNAELYACNLKKVNR